MQPVANVVVVLASAFVNDDGHDLERAGDDDGHGGHRTPRLMR